MQEELLRQILSEIKEVKSDVNELKEGQNRIEAKLDATFEQVGKNAEGITELNNKLNGQAHLTGVINKRVTFLENEQIGAKG